MLKLFINAWKVKEIRAKLLYTLLILAIVRLGAHIALPGIDLVSIKAGQEMFGSGTLYNIIAGGYNSRFSIFSMGIGPYITASIIMQLLTVAIPKIEQ
ncbi:MAG TPA: preprotein translocase subunit SecY, partial [Firmicutes bacterium]|nr:preprotein translocase subunit SecY [Bacillota bacterium]